MLSWYYDGVTAKTRNLGTLGGTVQLGDGTTVATFPTQVFPHGMSFDGSSDYLLRAESGTDLTFTDPAPFSVEALCVRTPLQIGAYSALFCKNGGGAGSTAPFLLYLRNDAGTMKLAWGSVSAVGALRGIVEVALGNYWPAGAITHVVGTYTGTTWLVYMNAVQAFSGVAAGCYAPDAASQNLYVGGMRFGSGAIGSFMGCSTFNWAVYPFTLQPGEVAQLYQLRRSMLQRGF